MRKLFGSALLVCAISGVVPAQSGGGTHEGGNDTPPCPPNVECPNGSGGNSASAEETSVFLVWINGSPFVFTF